MNWLWPGRLPLGKVVMLDGDPGVGKSTLLLDLAARLSRGAPMPDGAAGDMPGCYGSVILTAEDGLSDTIRPRLDAAGADCEKIVALESVGLDGKRRSPTVNDLDAIAYAIASVNALLVIVDPLVAFLLAATNSHRDQDIRAAVMPLAKLAQGSGTTVAFVRHLNKRNDQNPLYRGGGSIGIIGAARAGLLVARDPDDDDRRILAVPKNNLAPPAPSLAFRLQADEAGRLRIAWEGETGHTARQLLAETDSDEERSALEGAIDFLRQELAVGAVPTRDLKRTAADAGVAWRTVERAKAALGVRALKDGRVWRWELPSNPGGLGGLEANPLSDNGLELRQELADLNEDRQEVGGVKSRTRIGDCGKTANSGKGEGLAPRDAAHDEEVIR